MAGFPLMLGVIFIWTILFGQTYCDNHTYYYRISAIILNYNYTSSILDQESVTRNNVSREITSALKMIYTKGQPSYTAQKGKLINVTLKDILFGPPSHPDPRNSSLIKKERTNFPDPEIGLYFYLIVQLDFNISKPSGGDTYVHNIRERLDGIIIQYMRYFNPLVSDWQLGQRIFLNSTTLVVEELPSSEARRMVDILKYKNNFVPTFVHQTVISKEDHDALSVISYFGCALSVIGLAITIVTIVVSRKLRRFRGNQILLQLCVALLGALLFYSFGIRQVKDPALIESCKAVAAFLHYFILASMLWASIEAYNLYQDLVKVFNTSTLSNQEFMCRASLVGWVPPGVIVGTTVLISDTSYGFHVPDIKNQTLCWLKPGAFYGALLSPVLLLVMINTVIFVFVMREILKMPQSQEQHSKLAQFRATISVFVLLGLNWIFAGLAAIDPLLVLQYLFTITCSFQGFFIFILHGFLKKDFREAWTQLSTNNRVMEMLRSHSNTQKTNSSSLSHNSLTNSNSQSYGSKSQATKSMADGDSGIDVQQKTEKV